MAVKKTERFTVLDDDVVIFNGTKSQCIESMKDFLEEHGYINTLHPFSVYPEKSCITVNAILDGVSHDWKD